MPTITRWFRVTHDINADPEMWEIRELYGDRAGFIWLECLSIADRNSGALGPDNNQTRNQLAAKCRTTRKRVSDVITWCITRGWIVIRPQSESGPTPVRVGSESGRTQVGLESDCTLRVAKWAKYNNTRDVAQFPSPPRPTETRHSDTSPGSLRVLSADGGGEAEGQTGATAQLTLIQGAKADPPLTHPPSRKGLEHCARLAGDPAEGFDAFYAEWPKHVDKKETKALWIKIHPDSATRISIMAAAHAVRIEFDGRPAGEIQYCLSPWRFLKREKWTDQREEPVKAKPPPRIVGSGEGDTVILQNGQQMTRSNYERRYQTQAPESLDSAAKVEN